MFANNTISTTFPNSKNIQTFERVFIPNRNLYIGKKKINGKSVERISERITPMVEKIDGKKIITGASGVSLFNNYGLSSCNKGSVGSHLTYTKTKDLSNRKVTKVKRKNNTKSPARGDSEFGLGGKFDSKVTGIFNVYNNTAGSIVIDNMSTHNYMDGTKNCSTSRSKKVEKDAPKTGEKPAKKLKDKFGTNFFQRNLTRPFLQKRPNSSARNKRNSTSVKKNPDLGLSLHSKIMGKI